MGYKPVQYASWAWSAQHCTWAQATIGDAASQARWEALALLLAMTTWQEILMASGGNWHMLGDALGMLEGATKFRSKDPEINFIFMEMALLIVEGGRELHAEHIWSERNALANAVSRLEEGASLPRELQGVPRAKTIQPRWKILQR